MKHRIAFINLPLVAVFLVLASISAMARTTWYVDGVNDSDSNNCKSPQTACKTIGHAIVLIRAHNGDSIMVAPATYNENLTIYVDLRIVGSGAIATIIDGGGKGSVIAIGVVTDVTLSNLTIRNGLASAGGGINNPEFAVLTINNSTISGNQAYGVGLGGGIVNSSTLTINNSTLSGNTAAGRVGGGGGIANSGKLAINNSTISGNTASLGNGIFNGGLAAVQNSIVANNYGGNCYGTMTSQGYNVSSDNTCNFNGTGDLNNTDPKLGPLKNNGGPTQTQALLVGSPAINAGNPRGCTDGQGHLLNTDQRGKPRPDKKSGLCDMGAFERQKY